MEDASLDSEPERAQADQQGSWVELCGELHTQLRGGAHNALPEIQTWTQQEKRQSKMKPHHSVWSLNTGGLDGAWRALHMLDNTSKSSRPAILCLQEVGCSEEQWLGMQHYLRLRGYQGYCTGMKNAGEVAKRWHRGVATFVADFLPATFADEHTWHGGQYHFVQVGQGMLVNYYVSPDDDHRAVQVASFYEQWQALRWAGKWLWLGDYNETYDNSWISTASVLSGGAMVQFASGIESTRWQGNRLIDMALSNQDLKPIHVLEEKISDHKVLLITLSIEKHQKEQTRFCYDLKFDKPSWLTKVEWQECFDKAVNEGISSHWEEAIAWADTFCDWPEEDLEGQHAVDLSWCVLLSQITWSFTTAAFLAMLCIPLDFEDEKEMKRVVTMANKRKPKGMEVKIQKRTMPKCGKSNTEHHNKMYKRLGRLIELEKKVMMGKSCKETKALAWKIFQAELHEVDLHQITTCRQKLEEDIKKGEKKAKVDAIERWRKEMNTDFKKKTAWINKKGNTFNATVKSQNSIADNKVDAVAMLKQYWKDLWRQQEWNEAERGRRAADASEILKPLLNSYQPAQGRPNVRLFAKKLGSIAGCAGPDGWCKEELLAISENNFLCEQIWENMQLWEIFESIPSAVRHCRLSHVPKKKDRILGPHQFRPICVMSVWWRAWSMTWLNSIWVKGWAEHMFPPTVAGGTPGAFGPEKMAAIAAHQLSKFHHGLSLDFRHAFDTVDLRLLDKILVQTLPQQCRSWSKLLVHQWCTMSRWICYEGATDPTPMISHQGLPQGDPAAALMMTTLNYALKQIVERELGHPSDVFHTIYMDDRTIIAKDKEVLEAMKNQWEITAMNYHLIENAEKAKMINEIQKGSCLEVLGALLGNPTVEDLEKSRMGERLKKAERLYKKVGILPTSFVNKLKDNSTYGRGLLDYGWIDAKPPAPWIRRQQAAYWKSAARTGYANPHMKNTIGGAHSNIKMVALKKQMRLLAERNKALENAGILTSKCKMDNFVESTLHQLGWSLERGRYRHPNFREGFRICELLDDEWWKCIGHQLRESYRQFEFELYINCNRHEVCNYHYGAYDSDRRQLAVKWAAEDSLAWMLLIGGIQSPMLKANTRGLHQRCSKCNCQDPDWSHLWTCYTETATPCDGLLVRHLWPRSVDDIPLCRKFLDGIRTM